jgi:hypothetical protein
MVQEMQEDVSELLNIKSSALLEYLFNLWGLRSQLLVAATIYACS